MNIDDNKTKPLKTYLVEGRVRVCVSCEVIAEDQDEAEELAKDLFYKHAGGLVHTDYIDFVCVDDDPVIDSIEEWEK